MQETLKKFVFDECKALDNVKGIILNGGENRVVDGKEVEVRPELYTWGYPEFP